MFKKLALKLKKNNKAVNENITLPIEKVGNEFLDGLTKKAVELYEKKCDINNFSKLVLSNPENTSHNDLVQDLFDNGVADPFVDEKLSMLADNKRFLNDLGLL